MVSVRRGNAMFGMGFLCMGKTLNPLVRGRLRLRTMLISESKSTQAISDVARRRGNLSSLGLRVAAIKPGAQAWSNLVNADLSLLRTIIGADPAGFFLNVTGALAIGTKAALLKRTDKTRKRLCTVFSGEHLLPPLATFACTRLIPLKDAFIVTSG